MLKGRLVERCHSELPLLIYASSRVKVTARAAAAMNATVATWRI
jgi:hypothetical protein